jgi:HD superfamily phosphohydrolase YqeK
MNQITDTISNPDPYYIKRVAEFSEAQVVVSSADIFSSTGIKLVAKGMRINMSFYDKLVRHKLAVTSIDCCLSVKGQVTSHDLALEAARLLTEEPLMAHMASVLPDKLLLRNGLTQIHLNDTLAFKLTLARETRPVLYQHSIRVALVSLYLGARLGLDRESMKTLATAAIFHDIGELHIDPDLLDSAQPFNSKQRQHIFVHPMIGYLILKDHPEYHPQVSNAVLDHHERLDGSGYPRSLKGAEISQLGQILAVAEITGSLYGRADDDACARVGLALKLNSRQFHSDLVGFVSMITLRSKHAQPQENGMNLTVIRTSLNNIAKILADWDQLCLPHQKSTEQIHLSYAHTRLINLKQGLFGVGFSPDSLDTLTSGIENDIDALAELRLLIGETRWQIKDTIYEVWRRWPDLEHDSDPAALALKIWISQAEQLQT